jgi:multidrug efflux system outer membrane protein
MRSRAVVLAAAAAAATLSGCSLAPRYQRPAAPVPATVGMEPSAAATVAAHAADAIGWRDVFADPRLQAVIALALQNNRDLRVAALNVDLVQAQYRIVRSQRFPQLDASGTVTRQRIPADLSSSGRPYIGNTWTVGVGLSAFELDFFGRVKSLSDAALEQYFSTEEARRSFHITLVATVAQQYLTERGWDEQVTLAQRTLELVEASLALSRRTFEAGRTNELDLRTAEGQVEAARFNLSVARERQAQAANLLVLLVGRPLPADLPPPVPLDAQALVADLPGGVQSEVLLRRPDILAAEHSLVGANALIGAARAAFFPSITLTAFGGTASAQLDGLFKPGGESWSFTPRINLPIFHGGALKASLDAAEVRKSIQVAQYERAIQGAFREVADALVTRAEVEEQVRAEAARVQADQRRYDLSDLRYRRGVDSYLTVLTAQRDLYASQLLLIQARLVKLTNLVDLYRALGGGWLERTEGPAVATTRSDQSPR